MARGVRLPWNSNEEWVAIRQIERENQIQFLTTQVLVNGMIASANAISAAVMAAAGSGGGEQAQKENALGQSLDMLREMLVPGLKKVDEDKMQKVKAILERERAQPLELRPMARPSKKKPRPGAKR